MGRLTFDELKSATKFQFGNNDAIESPVNYYATWVNRAYIKLTTQDKFWGLKRSFYFPQLQTVELSSTVDGVPYISVPDDALVINEVHDDTNDSKLTWVPWSEYIGYSGRATASSEGQPAQWVRNGLYIYLSPTPDAAYVMSTYYRKIPLALVLPNEVTIIGEEWDEPIIQLAVYMGKMWMGNFEAAKALKAELLETLGSLMTVYAKESMATDTHIQPDAMYLRRGS
jgi:hypothetical protein